jgi:phage minor structural protein
MLKVYDKNETDFSKNGLAVLKEAQNVCITREINGEYSLNFDLPGDNEKWQYLQQRNKIVCDGQQFRIYKKIREKQGVLKRSVECLHVIYDASQKLIPDFPDQIGYTPRGIMLTAFVGTQFHIMTDEEVTALGMSWVTDKTDIFRCSKETPMGIVKKVIENIGKGELYIDNYNIALVQRIGKDTGMQCTLSNNLQSLSDVEDGNSIVTRLYATGKNGMPLPSTVAPNGYLDSEEGIALYGVVEGYKEYDTEDPTELYQKALWDYSPANPERIDRASVAYGMKFLELYKIYGNNFKVNIGDSVKITNKVLAIDTVQRFTKYTWFPYSPDQSTVILGKPPKTLTDAAVEGMNASQKLNNVTNQAGEVKSEWFENLVGNLQQIVYDGLKKELALHRTGDLWEFGNNTAIAIVDGVLAIANTRKADGTWDFRTFGNGNGFVADLIVAGILKGIQIQQVADNGNKLLDIFKDTQGGKVAIYDNNGNLNIKMGVEGTGGQNFGGTLILYADSPYETEPGSYPYRRVEIGITGDYNSGVSNYRDNAAKVRISIEANSNIGPYIGIRNSDESLTSYLTQDSVFAGGKRCATEEWVLQKLAGIPT